MSDLEKYNKVFMESFSLQNSDLNDQLEYNSIKSWDSIGHMGMIATLEETFGIALETDDVIDFSSYNKGKEILAKYGIKI